MNVPEVKLLYIEKDERSLSYQRRKTQHEERERLLQESIKEWSETIIPNWDTNHAIGNKKIRTLCARGIPTNLRSQVWSLLIGNRIMISKEIYKDYLQLAEKVYIEQKEIALNIDKNTTKNELTSKEKKRTASIILIENDQRRTFPNLAFFHNSKDQERLVRILKVYACCRPDMGYVQGMSYVAGILLLILGSELETFTCFLNLMDSRNNVQFYQLDQSTIVRYTITFDYFFQSYLPDLYAHFSKVGVTSEMFLLDWNLTLFSKTLGLEAAVRFWDSFLCEGEVYIVRTAIGLLSLYKNELIEMELEGIGSFLTNFPRDMDIELMMKSISKISITGQRFENIYNSRRLDSEAKKNSEASSIFDEYMTMSKNINFDIKSFDLDRLKFWRRSSNNSSSTQHCQNGDSNRSMLSIQYSSETDTAERRSETAAATNSQSTTTTSTTNKNSNSNPKSRMNTDTTTELEEDSKSKTKIDITIDTEKNDVITVNEREDKNVEEDQKRRQYCILS